MKFAFLLLALASVVAARAEIVSKTVEYTARGVTLKGFLAYDDAFKGKRPAVIVVHEWWGLTDYPKKRAENGRREQSNDRAEAFGDDVASALAGI